jgi:hypothetical protein
MVPHWYGNTEKGGGSVSEVTAGREDGSSGVVMGWLLSMMGLAIWFFYAMTAADEAKAKAQHDRDVSDYAHQHYNPERADGGTIYGTD